MTFFDKWKEEHPGPHVGMGYPPDCPSHYGYEDVPPCDHGPFPCIDCWNREIPEEVKEEKKTIYAHMGFSEEQAEAIEDLNEGKKTPNEVRERFGLPKILDSGARREFGTGAVRDIQEGKGRCDLLPLDILAQFMNDDILLVISLFQCDGMVGHLFAVLADFEAHWDDGLTKNSKIDIIRQRHATMALEVSIHFEEGAKKYGENNWQKGIPVHCYIDSAVRHYLKFLRGDTDEPHDRAFCWNIMCAIWTCKHKPELNDYAQRDTSEVEAVMG